MKERIKQLVEELNKASEVYYSGHDEIMSNYEYDTKYDELLKLEAETGYSPDNSPTKRVGYEIKNDLKKVKHEFKALSLDKTKDRNKLKEWLGDHLGFLGWKMDGLTVQITFDNGIMTSAVTRGNGEIGEDVTHNAKYFKGIPKEIPFKGHVVVRGEAYISYDQFESINSKLPDNEKYKNPRNLASGSVRQLNAKESARRHIEFKAFELVYAENNPFLNGKNGKVFLDTYATRFKWMYEQGFDIVECYIVDKNTILDTVHQMEEQVKKNKFPSDGLVLSYNDVTYGKSLGMTGKFPKWSIAFKWQDELEETKLIEIEWNPSRTGLINPVAVFKPVELEGTTVTRASLHNVSVMEALKLGKGDRITVYKANMIIPQIAENLTKSDLEKIPQNCPVCGGKTKIRNSENNEKIIKTLYCENPDCPAKHIGKFTNFVERDRMNIIGLSESTLEKFIDRGFVKEFADIYHLNQYKNEITEMDGFGQKSYEKLIKSIEDSRNVKLENLISALGIENIGKDTAKKIAKASNEKLSVFNEKLESGNFLDVEDIGEICNNSIINWYKKQRIENKDGKSEYFNLLKEINVIEDNNEQIEQKLLGKTFVITGNLTHFENRDDLIKKIESLGGKVTSSVSKKTSYLINNDKFSSSSKNKKAQELNIKILSEDDFLEMIS